MEVGEFAWTLRNALYQEHFALTEEEAKDPMRPQLLSLLKNQTARNTEIYREIFRCYPDDNVKKLSTLEKWQSERNPDLYAELSPHIVGNAVEFPLDFLCEENLKIQISNKEFFVPDDNFT